MLLDKLGQSNKFRKKSWNKFCYIQVSVLWRSFTGRSVNVLGTSRINLPGTSLERQIKASSGRHFRTSQGRQIATSLGRSNRIFRGRPGDVGRGRPRDQYLPAGYFFYFPHCSTQLLLFYTEHYSRFYKRNTAFFCFLKLRQYNEETF